jgi:fatty acid desaturase
MSSAILSEMRQEYSSESERARHLRRWIRRGEKRLCVRHPALNHPDSIATLLTASSVAGMVALGWLYAVGRVPAAVCILGNALLASILHEIEHDLIHLLYFKTRPLARDLVLLLAWAFRGNVIHGWYRRGIHLHHHRASGTKTDVEERLLGLGQPWGPRRVLVMVDGAMAFLLNARVLQEEIPGFRRRELALASLPFYPLYAFVLVSFLTTHALRLLVPGYGYEPSAWFAPLAPGVDILAVAWVFPNYLRQASLQIVSSNVHYYGDVDGIGSETQVLRPLLLLPLQLFCFNFGTTHSFHHFVVEQPFYLRQLLSPWVLPAMRRYGVRFNDLGTFARANRFRAA